MLTLGRRIERGVLQDPRVFMEQEDGMNSGRKRWIYSARGAVADHPACMR
jgi:hypothetical protein